MSLGNNPYDQQHSLLWDDDENQVRFKYLLPSGTEQENVMVGIDEDGKLRITISKVMSSHNNSTTILSLLSSFVKTKPGDTTSTIISMKFNLPSGLDPNGFETEIDDKGLLTVTFTKLKPEKKKLVSIAKKMLGCLAHAVTAACFLICDKTSDAICSGDY